MTRRLFLTLACLAFLPAAPLLRADETERIDVRFPKGGTSTVVTGKVMGRDSIEYRLDAREGQFLSVSLRPDSQFANYNIYIPGKAPGDEALFTSDLGGREYTGQLYKTGVHTIAVFLNRAAARRGESANFDIAFRITDTQPDGPIPVDGDAAPANAPSGQAAVPMKEQDHASLLERQASLPADLVKSPVTLALLVLEPDLVGVITAVQSAYDTTENPSEVTVTVTEGGILDDDLMALHHEIGLARNSNNEWRVIAYQKGEQRR